MFTSPFPKSEQKYDFSSTCLYIRMFVCVFYKVFFSLNLATGISVHEGLWKGHEAK